MKKPLLMLLLVAACSSGGTVIPDVVANSATSGAPGVASWSAWPQAGHDGRRSGASTAVGPQTSHLRWTRKLEGNVTPGPVVAPDGTIVAASNAGILHGLDPATGTDRWTFNGNGGYGIDQSTSAAVLKDGTILWPGPQQTLFALSSKGMLLWKEVLDGQPSSPAVSDDGGTAFVGTAAGTVTAFSVNGAKHEQLWRVKLGGQSYGSVALSPTDPQRVYDTTDRTLVAIEGGKVAWTKTLGAIVEVSPAVGPDGTVVVGSNDPFEYGFHADGSLAWKYNHGGLTYSSPVVTADGQAWFGDHRAFVSGVEVASGKLLGRFRGAPAPSGGGLNAEVWTSPLVDAHHDVYWGTHPGHVYGRAADGKALFDIDTGATVDSYPAMTADGLLVIGVSDGRLIGIGA